MAAVNLRIRVDESLRNEARELSEKLGFSLSTAVTMFLKQFVREQALPFRPSAADPFHSDENLAFLRKQIEELDKGLGQPHDLIED